MSTRIFVLYEDKEIENLTKSKIFILIWLESLDCTSYIILQYSIIFHYVAKCVCILLVYYLKVIEWTYYRVDRPAPVQIYFTDKYVSDGSKKLCGVVNLSYNIIKQKTGFSSFHRRGQVVYNQYLYDNRHNH